MTGISSSIYCNSSVPQGRGYGTQCAALLIDSECHQYCNLEENYYDDYRGLYINYI